MRIVQHCYKLCLVVVSFLGGHCQGCGAGEPFRGTVHIVQHCYKLCLVVVSAGEHDTVKHRVPLPGRSQHVDNLLSAESAGTATGLGI